MLLKIDTKFARSGHWRIQDLNDPQKNLAVIRKSGLHLQTGKPTYKVRFADGFLVPSPIDFLQRKAVSFFIKCRYCWHCFGGCLGKIR